jgi:hypothetical protein
MNPDHPNANPLSSAAIPFEQIAEGLRAGDVRRIADALRQRCPERIADALRARNPRRIVEALRGGELPAMVEALLKCDEGKLQEVRLGRDARRVAEVLRSRNPTRLAAALRGRDPDRVVRALSGALDEAVAALRDRVTARGARPLTPAEARRIADALPTEDARLQALADALCARDPRQMLDPLPLEESRQIVEALAGRDVEAIARALAERDQAIWTQVFVGVLPRVTAAVRSRLALRGGDPDAAESVAQSVARTLLRRARDQTLQDYELATAEDLACLLVRVAWRKCCRRMRDRHEVSLPYFPGADGSDGEPAETFDPESAEAGPVHEAIRSEMGAALGEALQSFADHLDCVDRVILRGKLTDPPLTHDDIARAVTQQCGFRECSTKTIQRHWKKTHRLLADLLRADFGGEP